MHIYIHLQEEGAILPKSSRVDKVSSRPIDTNWASGRRLTVIELGLRRDMLLLLFLLVLRS